MLFCFMLTIDVYHPVRPLSKQTMYVYCQATKFRWQLFIPVYDFFFRTKVLVLELLAAVCLVRGGHDIILQAFDNFKVACNESRRFSKLMQYFKFETDNVDFMVSHH